MISDMNTNSNSSNLQVNQSSISVIARTLSQKRYLQILAILLLIATAYNFVYNGIIIPNSQINMDFQVYYKWAKLFSVDGWYVRAVDEKNTQSPNFYYPPFWGLVIHPLTFLPFSIAKVVWFSFNIFLVIWFIRLVFYWLDQQKFEPLTRTWLHWFLTIIILSYTPIIDTLRGGQVNILLLVLFSLSLYYYEKGNKGIAGILLGIASMTKLVPILMLGYWFWKKEYRVIVYTIATIIGATTITLLLYGPEMHLAYLKGSAVYSRFVLEHWDYQANVSFYSLLRELQKFRILPAGFPALVAHYIFALTNVGLLLLVLSRKKTTDISRRFEYCAVIPLIPLVLTYTEPHHFAWLLLGYTFAIIYATQYKSYPAKILFCCSWLLILVGYAMDNLSRMAGSVPYMRHIHFLGVMIQYIAILLVLAEYKKNNRPPIAQSNPEGI